jgi:GNAT superfamily N-acetyltransferase
VIRVERVDQSDDRYQAAVGLRRRVLLDPIGLDMARLEAMFPGFEARFEHFVALAPNPKGERVVGVVCLLADEPASGMGKLMQMAVDPQRQGEGVGTRLVAELEKRAFGELGLTRLFCHAREDAAPFYGRLGWRIDGEPFDEAGVKHFRMTFSPEDHPHP